MYLVISLNCIEPLHLITEHPFKRELSSERMFWSLTFIEVETHIRVESIVLEYEPLDRTEHQNFVPSKPNHYSIFQLV